VKYPITISMLLSVDEFYELQLSLTKKLKNEMFSRKVTEQKLKDWAGKGSIDVDNVLLCELNAVEVRVHLLEELLEQVRDAFVAAQAAEQKPFRRARPKLDAEA